MCPVVFGHGGGKRIERQPFQRVDQLGPGAGRTAVQPTALTARVYTLLTSSVDALALANFIWDDAWLSFLVRGWADNSQKNFPT